MENKNKLVDVVKQILTSSEVESTIHDYYTEEEKHSLYGNLLKNDIIGKMIFSCEEFSEVESIEIVDSPAFNIIESANRATCKEVSTLMLNEDTKFKGKIYIYSIQLSHENFDMNSFMNNGEDDILLTPTIYDQNTFTPRKGITLFFSPETAQDMSLPVCIYNKNGEKIETNKFKENMHKLLDKALDNSEKYKAKGFRKIIVRGYFPEKITSSNITVKVII